MCRVRLGGWWIGDTNGGGSQASDHQTDLSYGSGGRVSFGLLDEATAVNYAVYYRAGSYARPGFDGSSIARDGTTISDVTAAQGLSDPMFAVDPTDYGLPPCPESARNETVTTGARLPRPDAETRARALPPLTRPPPSPADELSCTCDKGTTFCTRVESGHVTMLSPVEVAVVVICVLIVVLVAICMCAFAAKKKMIVKEVKHGPGNAL